MKEATGEANMTIITVVIIGVITMVAVPIVTGLINSTKERACCVNNGGQFKQGHCYISETAINDDLLKCDE